MNREQYDYLTQFESNFKTAVESGYSRNIPRHKRRKLVVLYEELTGTKHSGNIYCSPCLVDLLKAIKPHFDKYAAKLNKKKYGSTEGKSVLETQE